MEQILRALGLAREQVSAGEACHGECCRSRAAGALGRGEALCVQVERGFGELLAGGVAVFGGLVAAWPRNQPAIACSRGDESTPLRRNGTVEEVAAAALFLAEQATFTTNIELAVDGGFAQGLGH